MASDGAASAGTTNPPSMQRFDDSAVRRVLVVVAHPDDAEYGTSAAAAQWTSEGVEVAYLLATRGERGMAQTPPDEAARIRHAEQRRACDIVGVQRLTILDFPDGAVEYGLELRAAIAREIREFRPDAVVSGSGALRAPWGIDHADHRAVGLACIDAVRDAGNRWMFEEQIADGLEPWAAPTHLFYGSLEPTHFKEISETNVERGAASLDAHVEYFRQLPDHPTGDQLVRGMLGGFGKAAGVPFAMGFATI